MWESLLAGALGGVLVTYFAEVLRTLGWIKEQRWTVRRDLYKELLWQLSRFYVLNRQVRMHIEILLKAKSASEVSEKDFLESVKERDKMMETLDSNFGYAALFVDKEAKDSLVNLMEFVREKSVELSHLFRLDSTNPIVNQIQLKATVYTQTQIIGKIEETMRAVQRSAEKDLRFEVDLPFAQFFLGKREQERVADAEQPAP